MSQRRWDTPTDGISRKKFDRAMDSHVRRHVRAMEEIEELQQKVKRLDKVLAVLWKAADDVKP